MRLVLIFLALAVLVVVPFAIWGDSVEAWIGGEGTVRWLREQGDWAWAVAILLLIGDLVLPLPATAILSALGIVYGPVVGGAIGAVGSVFSGALAYGACRLLGRRAAERIAGERDLARGERLFASVGGWIVALSRWLPVFPEVVACMAGLARMPARSFFVALACGSVPMAFTFAFVGAEGHESPALAVALSALIPVVLWPLASWLLTRRIARRADEHETASADPEARADPEGR